MLKDLKSAGTGTDGDLLDATLFIDTESYFGFDFRLLKSENSSLLEKIDAGDSMDLFCQWSVKPGHLQDSISDLIANNELTTCVGRGDLFEQATGLTTREMVGQVLNSLKTDSRPQHARRRHTMPAMGRTVMESLGLKEEQNATYVDPDLAPMSFSVQEISHIQNGLRALWAPKILTVKVLNAFTNFNDGILDPSLYGYFIELLPIMKLFKEKVVAWNEGREKSSLEEITEALGNLTENFERAYCNRFYNSNRMGDITDFNLDFNGGIQQLITSFDSAYKAICSELGRPESFVYVAGNPGIFSTRFEARLDYYHVFQPEIFASIANHEAATFYFTRYCGQPVPPFAVATDIAQSEHPSHPDQGALLRRLSRPRRSKDPQQKVMWEFVTDELFKVIVVDLLAFYFGYNRNYSVFAYWYWGYYAQTYEAYSDAGKVDVTRFGSFMLRMRWIERMTRSSASPALRFGMTEFDNSYQETRKVVDDFLDSIWNQSDLVNWNREAVYFVESKFGEIHRTHPGETTDQITERLESEMLKMRAKLEQGETCVYAERNEKSSFKFTEQIFYAYLSLLKKRFGDGDILLDRPREGIAVVNATSAKALFDPVGGIFTHDPETRRQRFRYRAGFTMSLWDMAQKEKKRTVLERLRRTI